MLIDKMIELRRESAKLYKHSIIATTSEYIQLSSRMFKEVFAKDDVTDAYQLYVDDDEQDDDRLHVSADYKGRKVIAIFYPNDYAEGWESLQEHRDLMDEAIKVQDMFREAYANEMFVGVDEEKVHISTKLFEELFTSEDIKIAACTDDHIHVKAEYKGTMFLALFRKKQFKEAYPNG